MKYGLVLLLILFPLMNSYGESDLLQDQSVSYREEGYKLQSAGDYARAIICYQKAIGLNPRYVECHNDLGVVYEAMGLYDRAVQEYEESLKLNNTYLPAYTNLAFLYEKQGNIKEAAYNWQKRYEFGQQGEYWWEVSRQHLLQLGTYPELQKETLEKAAVVLSQELVYKREQQRLKAREEAKLHFDAGASLFLKGDYASAIKEFNTALSINSDDAVLESQIRDFSNKAIRLQIKEKAVSDIEGALSNIKNDDLISAVEKLRSAIAAVAGISSGS